ncbi:hypothetical protein KUTeg_021635 [Tegillarca granosa]|uniref:VWFD domain-containing protein n=1 Tax=Tegillarca granosa TaxID=220873 RepID=A0ABQ9E8J5_TEGGR|nr:hypothetical protein KUTeg_021635 [Tegillarca granosa]
MRDFIMINFPSGARLKVSAFPLGTRGYLNVGIQAPTDDLESTEGLCGTFDHNPGNDFKGSDGHFYNKPNHTQFNQFVGSWSNNFEEIIMALKQFKSKRLHFRISSLLMSYTFLKPIRACLIKRQYIIRPSNISISIANVITMLQYVEKQPLETQVKIISCEDFIVVYPQLVINSTTMVCGKKCIPIVQGNANGRRSVYDFYYNDDDHDEDIPYELSYKTKIIERKQATSSRITREFAQKTCVDALKSSNLYQHCGSIENLILPSFLDACVKDMLATNSDQFVLSALMALDDNCANEILKNTSYYTIGPNHSLQPPEILTTFYCPNNCNMQGECVQGVCHCHHGFTSSDCSVKSNVVPNIRRIRGHQCQT